MKMNIFGNENGKTILLIHGAGTSYKMWTAQIDALSETYQLYIPTLNGHAIGESQDYISPRVEAQELIKWFDERNISNIDLICGASLGANVAAEILIEKPDFAKNAFIESLKSYHYGTFMTKVFCLLGKKLLKKAANVTGVMDGSYQKEYISDDMKYVLTNMTSKSMINILLTASNYSVPKGYTMIQTRTMIVYGSKEESICRSNTELLKKQITNCQCIVLDGYEHGELSIGNPMKHIEMIRTLMSDSMRC